MSPAVGPPKADVDVFIESTHGDRATQHSRSIPGRLLSPRSRLLMQCPPVAFHDRDVEHRGATAADSRKRSAWAIHPGRRGRQGTGGGGLRTVRPMLSGLTSSQQSRLQDT